MLDGECADRKSVRIKHNYAITWTGRSLERPYRTASTRQRKEETAQQLQQKQQQTRGEHALVLPAVPCPSPARRAVSRSPSAARASRAASSSATVRARASDSAQRALRADCASNHRTNGQPRRR